MEHQKMRKNKIFAFVFILFFVFTPVVYSNQAPENGTVKELDGQGRLKAILKYKQGHLIRKMIYYENGKLILDTIYKQSIPVVIKTYYLNGVLKSVWTQKSGEARFYFPTGQHNITIPVKNPKDLHQQ